MDLGLSGRAFVVTGASSGIGRSVVLALAAEGCRLAIGARRSDLLDLVAAEAGALGAEIVAVSGDLTDAKTTDRLLDTALKEFGALDGIVTCVGSTPIGTIDELSDAEWTRAFETKLLSTIRIVRRALEHFGQFGSGRVVMIAGNAANVPSAHMVTSGAMNAALNTVAVSLARQYGPKGIGIVCVNPGPVGTARYQGLMGYLAKDGSAANAEEQLIGQISDRRIASPEEIGKIVAFLASPIASHLTGTSVVVDGGQFS